jgi:hypothetical protein
MYQNLSNLLEVSIISMPKVALIISGNFFKSPIWFYTMLLDKLNVSYDIISWNRLSILESNTIQFNLSEGEDKGYLGRLISYLRYKKFIIKQLEQGKYDRVFVFTIALGILMYPYLRKAFKNRFVFDIRDHSLIINLKKRTSYNLIKNSVFTVISSRGYLKWLPKSEKYYFAHNYPFTIKENIELINEISHFNPDASILKIVTIGSLRDYNANRVLIDNFGNNQCFHLKFIGSGPVENRLINYAKIKEIMNVEFHGFYHKHEELSLIHDADLINNLTGNGINSKTLTTNRFYLSVIVGIPMIVNDNTYQGNLSKRYSLGCNVKSDKPLEEQLQVYLKSFDRRKYDAGRYEFIKTVELDMQDLEKAIHAFLNKKF